MHSTTTTLPIVAIDLAKNTFQLYYIGTDGKPVNRRITRARLLTFFANRERSLVAMETCGGAHHWARQLMALGHEVKLLPAQHVKAFVQGDKTDAKDAQAIYVAAGQAHIHPVPVKSVHQQSLLMLHNQRAGLLKERIATSNRLRACLLEFGIALPEGAAKLLRALPVALAQVEDKENLPTWLLQSMHHCMQHIAYLNEAIAEIECTLKAICTQDPAMHAIRQIPGIGTLTATALIASVDIHSFESARQFASSLGLAPRQTGTGGKTRQLGLSKRGNVHLRQLLMHGARRCPHAHARALSRSVIRCPPRGLCPPWGCPAAGIRANPLSPSLPLADRTHGASPAQCSGCRDGQQTRAHRLGGAGARQAI